MADKTNVSETAREESLNESPKPINITTLIAAAVFLVVIIIGIFMIGKFFTSGSTDAGRNANSSSNNINP